MRLAVQRELVANRALPGRACLKNNLWSTEGIIAGKIRRERLPFDGGNLCVDFCFGKEGLDARPGKKHLAAFLDKVLKSLSLFSGRCFQRISEDQNNPIRIAGKLSRGAFPARNFVVYILKKQISGASTSGAGGVRRGNRHPLLLGIYPHKSKPCGEQK